MAMLAMTCLFTGGPAGAQDLPEEVIACRNIEAAEERLNCYDRAVERYGDPTGESAAASSAPASPPEEAAENAPLPSPQELFGHDPVEVQRRVDRATGREELQQITAEVVELIEIAPDRIAVKLDNGQIWRQTVPGRFFLREGHEVEIRRASLGSYMMSRTGSSRSIRVERAD